MFGEQQYSHSEFGGNHKRLEWREDKELERKVKIWLEMALKAWLVNLDISFVHTSFLTQNHQDKKAKKKR